MNARTRCIANVKDAAGETLTRDQVSDIVTELDALASRADPAAAPIQRLKNAARERTAEEILNAQIEKRNRAINILRRREIKARLAEDARKSSKALRAAIAGDTGDNVKAGLSTDSKARTLEQTWTGGLVTDLRKAGLLERFTGRGLVRRRDVPFERAVAQEMARLNGGPEKPTGNKQAAEMAAILNKWSEAARIERNRAGAFIGKRSGYIAAQTHDPVKIAKTGRDAWKAEAASRLDESTFAGVVDRGQFLNRVYANLSTGDHMGPPGRDTGGFTGLGPGNLAKRLSQRRILHFKSAADWFAYNEAFGSGNLFDGALFNLKSAARDTAVMRDWGPNPEAMLRSIAESEIDKAKNAGDTKEVARLQTATTKGGFTQPGISALFRTVIGADDIGGNPLVARRAAAIRAWVSMTKLGGMLFSQFSDIANRASALRKNGVNLLDDYSSSLASLTRGRGSDELRNAGNLLGVGLDGTLGSVLSRFSAVDNLPGRMTRMMGHFFRLNGSAYWQDAMTTGVGDMLAHNLGVRAGDAWGALPETLRTMFGRYGIDEAGWNEIRASGTQMVEGRAWLTAENLPDGELKTRLQTYFVDQSRTAMTMPGAAERAWVTQFGPAGSLAGEAARFALQFKQFPISYARRHLFPAIRNARSNPAGLAHLIVMTAVLGYLSMSAKQLAKGQQPNNPIGENWASAWGAAFTQGGGMGIFGDYLLGEYDRFGNTIGETMAGPAVGMVSDWVAIFARIGRAGLEWEGDPGKIGSAALRATLNSTPFANLFYTRVALDWLVLYQIQEMLDPGALRRREQQLASQNNREFLVRPSQAIPRGGGDRLFEGVRGP